MLIFQRSFCLHQGTTEVQKLLELESTVHYVYSHHKKIAVKVLVGSADRITAKHFLRSISKGSRQMLWDLYNYLIHVSDLVFITHLAGKKHHLPSPPPTLHI
jgi:hypothetical protein